MEAFIVYELENGYVTARIDDIETVLGCPMVAENMLTVQVELNEWLTRDTE